MDVPIGRLGLVAIDASDHRALADFYRGLIGGTLQTGADADEWIELRTANGSLAFQLVAEHLPPTWPGGERPAQAHVDVYVLDRGPAEAAVLALGGSVAAHQPAPDEFLVCLDPDGHPFCLIEVPPEVFTR